MPTRLIDAEPAVRANGIQICCIGLPRTGTVSLYRALSLLHYRAYHGLEFVANGKRDMSLLLEALQLKHQPTAKSYVREDFDKIWPTYDALIDLPGFAFVPELLAAYPEAKFILTTRDEKAWLSSMRKTVFAHLQSWPLWLQSFYDEEHAGPMRRLLKTWVNSFTVSWEDEDVLRAFREHNACCRGLIPEEKLLILNLDGDEKIGWDRLCSFLGVEVPEQEWPHANNQADYATRSRAMRQNGFWKPMRMVVVAGGLAGAIGWGLYVFGAMGRR